MAATRTQIYLSREQRADLDRLARSEDRTLASLIRDAVDEYLDRVAADPTEALEESFGAAPNFGVPPRSEWDERAASRS